MSAGKATSLVEGKARSPARTWSQWAYQVVRDFAIVWTLYTLSIGPMFWTWYGAMYADGPFWVARFYLPLVLMCELVPPFGWAVNWYIDLWIL